MKKLLLWILGIVVVLVSGYFVFHSYSSSQKQEETIVPAADYKNIEYLIGGQYVKLQNGVAETEVAPGSASKIITRYFGNELKTDLNGDGKEDVAFILTQQTGGSGVFFYAVSALNTDRGYVGSDGYLLGDRIAPQTTEVSKNPQHKNVVVFNYADRKPGEPMTAKPSLGKSVYLKLNPVNMQWAIVEPNFEGESASGIRGIAMLGPTCPVLMNPPDPQCADKPYKTSLDITTKDQAKVIKTVSTDESGVFKVDLPPGEYSIRSAATTNMLPRCASNGSIKVSANAFTETTVYCDTGIR